MNHFKVPPVHLRWAAPTAGDSSAADTVHRAYTRMVWRGGSANIPSRTLIVLAALTWPARVVMLSFEQVRRYGKWIRERTGKSRARQLFEMLGLALRRSIPPKAYTLFELYEPDLYARAQSYLHRYEVKRGLFIHLNRYLGGDDTVARSKIAFERRCRAAGLPTPETLVHARGGEFGPGAAADATLAGRDFMIKPSSGRGGKGIERWDSIGERRHRDAAGLELSTEDLVARIREISRAGSVLVQPRLSNHPDIADLGGGVLTTARVMTVPDERGEPEVVSAAFRIAVHNQTVDNFHQGGLAAAVDLETGRLGPAISIKPCTEWHDVHPSNGGAIAGRELPGWSAAMDLVRDGHRAMPELVVVGWDVAFTSEGPVLIEANFAPDVDILQRPHKQPLGETRFAELLAHHLKAIESGLQGRRTLLARIKANFGRGSRFSPLWGVLREREVDTFVVSFPKCGRTWLRVQLGRIMQQHFGLDDEEMIELQDIARDNPGVPHVRFLHAGRPQRRRPEELSHARVDYFRHRKVILIVRDPRDVVVSMYMQRTKRGMKPVFNGTLSEFLDEPVGSFNTLLEFYNLWAERLTSGHVLIVRYEDMHTNPARELRRVVDFLGLPEVTEDEISDAVEFSSFDKMKAMEREDRMGNSRLRPGDPGDPESFKARKGQVGGYRDYLSDEEVASLEERMRRSLRAFYEA